MTKEEAIYLLRNTAWLAPSLEPIEEAVEMAVEALKAGLEPVEDAVDMAIEALKERPKGKWVGADTQCGIACSVCGVAVDDFCHSTDYIDLDYNPNFCPHCGAMMKGADDDSVYDRCY